MPTRRTVPTPPANPTPNPRLRHTTADVYELLTGEVLPRLSALEKQSGETHRIVAAAGLLKGKGDELFAHLVSDFRAREELTRAQELVRASRAGKLRWLARPKAVFWALGLGIASGIGYAIVFRLI